MNNRGRTFIIARTWGRLRRWLAKQVEPELVKTPTSIYWRHPDGRWIEYARVEDQDA